MDPASTATSDLDRLLRASRSVRREGRARRLTALAAAVADGCCFDGVALLLHRREWHDLHVAGVHGLAPAAVARVLALPLLDDRSLQAGVRVRPADGSAPAVGPWQAGDVVLAPMTRTDGRPVGYLALGRPTDGLRPDAGRLRVVEELAEQVALALESAEERAVSERRRESLGRLLEVSSAVTRPVPLERILHDVCAGIRDALRFANVSVELHDRASGLLVPRAAVGWLLDGTDSMSEVVSVDQMAPLMDPAWEREGCYLLPNERARELLVNAAPVYRSRLNGSGPYGWQDHWLFVPMLDDVGGIEGVIWADDPVDRLIPSDSRLRTLRVFANQAAAAVAAALLREELRFMADHDGLTRLGNRRAFVRAVDAALAGPGAAPALALVDLDGFKALNDARGHAVGDEALRRVAEVLAALAGGPDLAFRLGGDEFALLLCGAAAADAASAAARVEAAVHGAVGDRFDGLSASCGVAVAGVGERDGDELVRRADAAMYDAKRRARTRRAAA